jgi:predicted XRE-type DNA-binding protein
MNHDHNHDHGSSHTHKHSHDHAHTHDHGHENGQNMSIEEKLAVLFSHWVDHNDSHKDNFFSWAKKAEDAGLEKIAAHLEQAGLLSEKVTQELKQAQKILNG